MHIVEEPLVGRREILRSLRLGAPSTEAPFGRLRSQRMASPGWSVLVRRGDGRVAGRLHLYSVLNVDAARAARRREHELARRLAARADALEHSSAGTVIRDTIRRASARLSAHLAGSGDDDAWGDQLRRYLDLRQGAGWEGLDRDALAREWLVRSEAWIRVSPGKQEQIVAAIRELATDAQAARAEELADELLQIDSFTGIVSRLDPEAAEIVAPTDETWVMSRRELDREGLARLGEAVTIIREELPGGGEAWLAAPAVDLRIDAKPPPRADKEITPFVRPAQWVLGSNDARWLTRTLTRDPFALPRTPVRLAPED